MLAQGSRCAHACIRPFSVIERYVWIASVCNTTLFPPMEAIVMLNGRLAAQHYAHAHAHACTSDCATKLLKQKLSCTKHGFLQNLIGFSNHRSAVGCVNNLAWNQCSPPYWTRGSFPGSVLDKVHRTLGYIGATLVDEWPAGHARGRLIRHFEIRKPWSVGFNNFY